MKVKILTAIVLVAAVATGIWLRFHREIRNPALVSSAEKPITAGQKPNPMVSDHVRQTGPNSPAPAPALTTPEALSESMRQIIDTNGEYRQRVAAIHNLSTNRSPADDSALQTFLMTADRADSEQASQVFKNELLDKLCALNPPPVWLADALIHLYEDRSQNNVIRDYAVQHLAAYYAQLELLQIDDAQTKMRIRDEFWQALKETDNSIAGTALLALEHLSQNYPEFDRDQIRATALRLAAGESTGELSRITAFQVCGHLGVNDAEQVLLQAAESSGTLPLRISAIGALGGLGDSGAKELLTTLASGSEPRLRLPAQRALNQIQRKERLRQAAGKQKT